MPFKRGNPGCCSCSAAACGTITFTIKGCPSGSPLVLPGATVTVYDGNANTFPVLATGTTNSSGVYVQSIAAAKTYYYEISRSRFATSTGTVAAACSGSSNTAVGVTLSADTSTYTCFPSPCGAIPIAKTLFLTDPIYGLVTLTIGGAGWAGSLDVPWTNVRDAACANPASRNVRLEYLIPSNTTQFGGLSVSMNYCLSGGAARFLVAGAGSSFVDQNSSSSNTSTCIISNLISFNLSFAFSNLLNQIYGTGTRVFTVSE